MEAEQPKNQDLNESTMKTEDLNQPGTNKKDSTLEQQAKGKWKQREEYSITHFKPFEKAYLANMSKFHEEHMTLERKKDNNYGGY